MDSNEKQVTEVVKKQDIFSGEKGSSNGHGVLLVYHDDNSTGTKFFLQPQVPVQNYPCHYEVSSFEEPEYWEHGVPITRIESCLDRMSLRDAQFEALYKDAKANDNDDFGSSHEFDDAMEDLENRLSKYGAQDQESDVVLLGNADFTQYDPRGYWKDSEKLELVPFLSFSSGNVFMWGDMGEATFFVPKEDIANMDFSRVRFYWDCC